MCHIGEIIKERRLKKGIRQDQIAKQLDVSTRTYQRMECGTMDLNQLERVCRILDLIPAMIPKEIL